MAWGVVGRSVSKRCIPYCRKCSVDSGMIGTGIDCLGMV
jgi:hypothetical protein